MTAKITSFIKKVFFGTAAIYFLTSALIISAVYFISDIDPATSGTVKLQLCAMLFGFISALGFAVTGLFSKLPSALSAVINFLWCYAAMYVSFFAISGNGKAFRSIFGLSIVLLAVYAVCAVICALVKKLESKKAQDDYTEVYTELKNDN